MQDRVCVQLREQIEKRGRLEMDRLASGRLEHNRYLSTCGKLAAFKQMIEDLEEIDKRLAAQDDHLPENVERIHG